MMLKRMAMITRILIKNSVDGHLLFTFEPETFIMSFLFLVFFSFVIPLWKKQMTLNQCFIFIFKYSVILFFKFKTKQKKTTHNYKPRYTYPHIYTHTHINPKIRKHLFSYTFLICNFLHHHHHHHHPRSQWTKC